MNLISDKHREHVFNRLFTFSVFLWPNSFRQPARIEPKRRNYRRWPNASVRYLSEASPMGQPVFRYHPTNGRKRRHVNYHGIQRWDETRPNQGARGGRRLRVWGGEEHCLFRLERIRHSPIVNMLLILLDLFNADLVYPFDHWTPYTILLTFDSLVGISQGD